MTKRHRPARRLMLPGSVLLLAAALAFLLVQNARSRDSHASDPASMAGRAGAAPASSVGSVLRASPPGRDVPAKAVAPAAVSAAHGDAPVPSEPPAVAGMVVGLDPETGTWGPPSAEQLRELAELRKLSASDADGRAIAKPEGPLPEVRHPDGHVSVELNGQFQEFTTVRLGPDGKPVYTCVQGAENAGRAVAEPAGPVLEER